MNLLNGPLIFFFTLVWVLLNQGYAQAELLHEVCNILGPLKEHKSLQMTLPNKAIRLIEIKDIYDQELDLEKRAAKEIFNLYVSGVPNIGLAVERCLDSNELINKQDFLYTLNSTFIDESFKKIKNAQSPRLVLFQQILEKKFKQGLPVVQVLTPTFVDKNLEFKAGFHRGLGSLVFNIDRIPASEWFIVFIHELLHSLDSELAIDSEKYANSKIPALLSQLEIQGRTPSSPELAEIEAWFKAGLGRGLFTEYRTWVPTLLIYREGLSEGLWGRVEWIEQVLASKPKEQTLKKFVYDFLDQFAYDPDVGIFSLGIVKEHLIQFRKKIREGHWLPPFGELEGLSK